MIIIRKLEERDIPAITEIYNHYVLETTVSFEVEALTEEQMRRRAQDIASKFPYFVAEDGGNPVGYCYVHPWKERAAYASTLETTVYLHPARKHTGLGRELMNALIEECRRRGYYTLIACITAENAESRAFHTSLGFRQVSLFKGVGHKFNRRLDVVDYQLMLHD